MPQFILAMIFRIIAIMLIISSPKKRSCKIISFILFYLLLNILFEKEIYKLLLYVYIFYYCLAFLRQRKSRYPLSQRKTMPKFWVRISFLILVSFIEFNKSAFSSSICIFFSLSFLNSSWIGLASKFSPKMHLLCQKDSSYIREILLFLLKWIGFQLIYLSWNNTYF